MLKKIISHRVTRYTHDNGWVQELPSWIKMMDGLGEGMTNALRSQTWLYLYTEWNLSGPMVQVTPESVPKRWRFFLSVPQWVTRTYFPRAHMAHALHILQGNSAALFATSLNNMWWFVGLIHSLLQPLLPLVPVGSGLGWLGPPQVALPDSEWEKRGREKETREGGSERGDEWRAHGRMEMVRKGRRMVW